MKTLGKGVKRVVSRSYKNQLWEMAIMRILPEDGFFHSESKWDSLGNKGKISSGITSQIK